jgi:hypothetical protein
MSQWSAAGGGGELITLDTINKFDDLPDVTMLSQPDVYEIRTGDLASDYVVPMDTTGDGNFDTWYSLVDGQTITA